MSFRALGPTHLVAALAYVDLNPVRTGLVGEGPSYPWSSAAAHCSNADGDPLIDAWAWTELGLGSDWEERLRTESAGGRDVELRRATYSGLPFGDKRFVEEMGVRLGRRLRRKPPGPAARALESAAGAA